MTFWFLGPLVATALFAAVFAYLHRGQRKKREAWRRLLAQDARVAAQAGGVGVLSGLVSDGHGRIPPVVAPFTGRQCVAFHIEIVTRERRKTVSGWEITWRRVFEDGVGQVLVTDASQAVVGRVDVRGARVLLPPDLGDGRILGVTVFASSSSIFDPRGLPPHLASFLQGLGLPAATKDGLFSPGRQVFFNERTFVPGQPIVAAAEVRAEAARTPIGESLWGAFATALIGGLVTMMFVAMASGGGNDSASATPAAGASASASAPARSARWACDHASLGLCTTYDVTGPNADDDETEVNMCRMGGGTVTTTCTGRPKVGCCTSKLSTGATQVRCVYADDPASAKQWTCDRDD
jgi:hypothetical protein